MTDNNNNNNNNKATTMVHVEGGSLQDRLKLLEEQRQRDAIKNNSIPSPQKKKVIQVEGGLMGVKDRLQLLEQTRQRDAAKLVAARECHITDPALVTDDLIRERMQWMASLQESKEPKEKETET